MVSHFSLEKDIIISWWYRWCLENFHMENRVYVDSWLFEWLFLLCLSSFQVCRGSRRYDVLSFVLTSCLFILLAFCFSIDILPTLLVLDTLSLFGYVLLVEDRTLRSLQVSWGFSACQWVLLDCVYSNKKSSVPYTLFEEWNMFSAYFTDFHVCMYVHVFTYATILYNALGLPCFVFSLPTGILCSWEEGSVVL